MYKPRLDFLIMSIMETRSFFRRSLVHALQSADCTSNSFVLSSSLVMVVYECEVLFCDLCKKSLAEEESLLRHDLLAKP